MLIIQCGDFCSRGNSPAVKRRKFINKIIILLWLFWNVDDDDDDDSGLVEHIDGIFSDKRVADCVSPQTKSKSACAIC